VIMISACPNSEGFGSTLDAEMERYLIVVTVKASQIVPQHPHFQTGFEKQSVARRPERCLVVLWIEPCCWLFWSAEMTRSACGVACPSRNPTGALLDRLIHLLSILAIIDEAPEMAPEASCDVNVRSLSATPRICCFAPMARGPTGCILATSRKRTQRKQQRGPLAWRQHWRSHVRREMLMRLLR